MLFQDRFDAGRLLASRLRSFANRSHTVVLALPRGGVPVGFEVCLVTPERFRSVSEWYWDFSQTSDEEVRDLLRRAGAFLEDDAPAIRNLHGD
jgi:predicted phosphoribosyltransferase